MKEAKRVYINNSGCKRRGLDSARMAVYFIVNGCEIVTKPRLADIIIEFTCSFKESRKAEAIEAIKGWDGYQGELIVLGCLPAIAEDSLQAVFQGKYLATKDLDQIDKLFPSFEIKFREIPDANLPLDKFLKERRLSGDFWAKYMARIAKPRKKKKAILRIANGCLGKCSYCVIRYATGRLKSKPMNVCRAEYRQLLQAGYRYFEIDAEDAGAYGLDMGTSLPALLSELSQEDDGLDVDWEIQTISPAYAVQYLDCLQKLVTRRKIIKLKCDIQSGNDRIIALMNRNYAVQDALHVFATLQESHPNLLTESQFIVGFPSEKESEFHDTVRVMEELSLVKYAVYAYSDMDGSLSARLPGKLSDKAKTDRIHYVKDFFADRGYKPRLDSHKLGLVRQPG